MGSNAAGSRSAGGNGNEAVKGNAWGVCDVCREEVPDMRCCSCKRWLHALCSTPSALSPAEYPPNICWTCPGCGSKNKVRPRWICKACPILLPRSLA
jgi:hypothetical protein